MSCVKIFALLVFVLVQLSESARFPVSSGFLSEEEASWIKENPVVYFGAPQPYPPFVWNYEGELQGLIPEIHSLISKKTGLELRTIIDRSADRTWDRAASGELHGIFPSPGDLPSISGKYLQSSSLFEIQVYAVVLPHFKGAIRNVEDLKNLKVGYIGGTKLIDFLLKRDFEVPTKTYINQNELIEGLLKGEVDVILGTMDLQFAISHSGVLARIAHVFSENLTPVVYSTHKRYPVLAGIIEKALQSINPMELNAVLNRWGMLKQHVSREQRVDLTESEKKWLWSRKVIKVASDPGWAPIESKNRKGRFEGISIDYMKILEEKLGVRFEIVKDKNWSQLIEMGRRGEVHLFSCVTQTPARKEFLDFTKPYLSFPIKIFTRTETGYIAKLSELEGLKVAVVDGYAIHEILKKEHPGIHLIPVVNVEEGLSMLEKRNVKAFIGNLLTTGHTLGLSSQTNLKVGGDTPYKNDLSIGVNKDFPVLFGIMEKALASISEGQRREIYRKWVPLLVETPPNFSLLYIIGIPLVALLITALLFNWRLKIQINRKTRELMLSQSNRSQSQKMEAVGRLAGGIAHDFNNILGGIIGFTDLALEETDKSPRMQRYLEKIMTASTRAQSLVRQILTFSRQDPEEKRPVQIGPVIAEAVELLKASLPSSIHFKTNIVQDALAVLADPTKIHEILINLCTNAADSMNNKGVINISSFNYHLKHELEGRLGIIRRGQYNVIIVEDSGEGMDEKILAKIFDPFFTTKDIGKGTGMGLAVVFGILRSHNANIIVNTQLGKGSSFVIYFPVTSKTFHERHIVKPAKADVGRERILLVDDEPDLMEVCRNMLSNLGYHVTTFTDSKKALLEFKSNPDNYDLIITDQTMPGQTGLELAAEVFSIRPDITVLMSTGYNNTLDHVNISDLGVSGIIYKPFRKEELAQKVKETISAGRPKRN